jgi:hypothetical protein
MRRDKQAAGAWAHEGSRQGIEKVQRAAKAAFRICTLESSFAVQP